MSEKTPPQWYVDDGLKKKGPYTLEKIQELLSKGEIQATSRIIHGENLDQHMNVLDLVKYSSDPAYSLLETLRAAVKKNAKSLESPPKQPLRTYFAARIKPKLPWILGATVVLLWLIWSVPHLIHDFSTAYQLTKLQPSPPIPTEASPTPTASTSLPTVATGASQIPPPSPPREEPPPPDDRDREPQADRDLSSEGFIPEFPENGGEGEPAPPPPALPAPSTDAP